MSAVKYDLVVIGSGPAGQRAAVAAAKMGKRVAVVEARSVVGGVCINTGTIPSKTMREAVLHLSGYNYRSIYGVNYRVKEKITMADLAFRVQAVIKTEVDVTEAQLSRNGIDVVHGIASFVDPHQVRVEGPQTDTTLEADQIIIAVGTKPARLRQGAGQRQDHHQQRPDSGPGDAAQVADRGGRRRDRRGVRLHVRGAGRARDADRKAHPAARVCRPGDYRGAQLPPARQPRDHAPGRRRWKACERDRLPRHGGGQPAEQEEGLGRRAALRRGPAGERGRPEPGRRRPGSGQPRPHRRGRALPDQGRRTFTPRATWWAFRRWLRCRWSRAASPRRAPSTITRPRRIPAFIPTASTPFPEISFIGKTEEQLTGEDVPYEVGMAYYREVARGQIRGDTTGRLKLIFHRDTRKVLGVHIIGEGASELVHIGQAVMTLDGTMDYFIDTVFNYPTLAECYKVAAFNGLGRLHRYQTE